VRVPTKTIVEKLEGKGYQIKRIDDIREGVRDSSGRLEYVRIRSRNKWFEISTGHFRSAISKRVLKSSNFNVKKYPTFYLFSGYGWGHGVGMCQWGAFGLAIRWKNAEWILNHYYPGAKIADLHELE
jgi:stage II sporulation protein D